MSLSDRGRSDEAVVVRVAGLAGSLRAGSATRMAVRCALRGAEEEGARIQLLDLGGYDLPFLGRERDGAGAKAVGHFIADLRAADGIVLGSPEIHGSVSGVLKNALDLADAEIFEGKMVGLIGIAGGRVGASDTLSHMRTIGRSLHAWVVPTQVSIAEADQAFDASGEPLDAEVGRRLRAIGREVAHFARLHKCEDHMQFMKEWEGAGPGFGRAQGT